MKEANSHECSYFGRKLGNIGCDDIDVSLGYVSIGSESDDEIYWGDCLDDGEEMLKERVTICCMNDVEFIDGESFVDDGHCFDIDLEDVLRFAAKHCRIMYERVLSENPISDIEIEFNKEWRLKNERHSKS